jgi:membrane peptidoglycan carboxypeptidase
LARVYSTLANSGKRPELLPILLVKDYKGKVLEKNLSTSKQVLDPKVAFLLTDILKDNRARAPEFGLSSYLVIKDHPEVAVKTGTSNDLRDNWAAGYNQNYLVITWVGNNNNSEMSRIASGITGASPIWNKIMSGLLADKTSVDWTVPLGVTKINCPGGKSEYFVDTNILPNYCRPLSSPSPSSSDQILNGAATVLTR